MDHDNRESLQYYASEGRFFEVYSLVMEGVGPDEKDCNGRTPLMLAADRSHLEVVKLLINSGADINCSDNDGWTVLHHASTVEIVQCLVAGATSLDVKDRLGRTPLMLAVQRSKREVVDLLIARGADIHCCDNDGWTLLHHAASEGLVEVVQCLLNNGVAVDKKDSCGSTPLMLGTVCKHKGVFDLLVNSGADIHCRSDNGWTLLHVAANNGLVEIIPYLLDKGLAIDDKVPDAPLMIATRAGHREVIELLIERGADIHYICKEKNWTLLHLATLFSSVEIVQCLVNKGIDLNVRDSTGETPLTLAVVSNKKEIIEYLLKAGADCNLKDDQGVSSFTYLIYSMPSVQLIKLCIETGAFVKPTDYVMMLENPVLKEDILKDVALCSQAVINRFNDRYLPALYEGIASSKKLPPIVQMKIRNGSRRALEIEKDVARKIEKDDTRKKKCSCNTFDVVPTVLSMYCVITCIESLKAGKSIGIAKWLE